MTAKLEELCRILGRVDLDFECWDYGLTGGVALESQLKKRQMILTNLPTAPRYLSKTVYKILN
jgi:hypothetical protein